ncbi:MAG TPA: polysaccharide biosynthesis/export family protein [Chthoniobacter sp.]|nr:polysaccharide biosynthesis/export family protein [Chthoniobacter sp.]
MNLVSLRSAWFTCSALLLALAPLRAQQATPAERPVRNEASAVVAATNSMEVLDSTRKLGAGDRLSYRIVQERREPVGLTVADSGEVEVPLIGRVRATGRTCKELAQSIKPLLEKEYFYHATVIVGLDAVSAKARGRVYISGQVRQQGPIEIPPDERFTLSKAILKAGGLADFANRRKIKLVRKDAGGAAQTIIVDLDAVTVHGQLDKDPELLPDDTIIVPEKFVNF